MTRRKKTAPPKHAAAPAPERHASIDRLEGDVAVLLVHGEEGGPDEERHVPRAQLPEGAREGDVVDLETLRVDAEATEALREEVREARARAQKGKPPPPSGSFDL
ncbi:DUF3006 domain-containing protein [Aggregicoccus sp. 17bor-14]|uniref:DUF3006 domain-containing protein n=1 Tax=Myxococcaceae TaxID=31 RepID=UPI0012F01B17|nr:DUF3006 domain-containing protein [Simulacricoccus sp. 17bor-14]MRI90050.1 DUF3006 domain-containing protein [Aggregicoccus sp. 17bor-14]